MSFLSNEFYIFRHCGGGEPEFLTFEVSDSKLVMEGMSTNIPRSGDTVTIGGYRNVNAVWTFSGETGTGDCSRDAVTVVNYNEDLCTNIP